MIYIMNKKVKMVFIILVILNIVVLGSVSFLWIQSDMRVNAIKNSKSTTQLKTFTLAELARYNGSNSTLPIYLALDGYVYDVTKGREFYQVGGPYHDLAGRDASKELHLVGGGIIKRKYPVVGKL
jgi:predicted heme/steroid binding protein